MKEKKSVGWECPRCHKILSPEIKVCKCNLKERQEKDTNKDVLLTEG